MNEYLDRDKAEKLKKRINYQNSSREAKRLVQEQ